ncbi:AAA family ATPase, partial [Polyangium sp. 15x6]|uniref:AAA family ATPase n=1 Tax=Polyangium sp. 15x6 TaxID=3042687 RepID=UPI00249A0CBC
MNDPTKTVKGAGVTGAGASGLPPAAVAHFDPGGTGLITTPATPDALAERIVREGHGEVMEELLKLGRVWQLGRLWSFTKEEHGQLATFKSLVAGYIQLPSPPRPLCLAVFGPPGSGKSHVVREICSELEAASGKKLPLTEVNLTVLASQADLVRVIRKVRLGGDGTSVPVVFFDEFDAPLNGVPLGWLSRFLAPMQDGTLFDNGDEFELKRAIYIFAGGTAARMADFGATSETHFREAKGPDFVSRLRGHIDVTGPNEPTNTSLRRAVIIRSALEDIAKARGSSSKPPEVSRPLLHAMLHVGRFRHGARSIKAIIEMAAASAKKDEELDLRHLPPDHVLNVHRDFGQLDPLSIGGLVGLSAGRVSSDSDPDPDNRWKEVSVALAAELWKVGAVIGYGGKWGGQHLTEELLEELSQQSESLLEAASRLTREAPPPQVRVEVFARDRPPSSNTARQGMTLVPVPAYWNSRTEDTSLGKAATVFRMRWTMSCRCVARVLVGGKTSEYSYPSGNPHPSAPALFRAVLVVEGGSSWLRGRRGPSAGGGASWT